MNEKQNNDKSFSQGFVENWLFEMPVRTGKSPDVYSNLLMVLQLNQKAGHKITQLGNDTNKFIMPISDGQVIVGQEINGDPEFIIELKKYNKGYSVELVGKKQGVNINAVDFYSDLLKIFKTLIFSGDIISDQGAGIWKKLIANNYQIQAYDAHTSMSHRLTDPNEIDDKKYNNKNTRFVLSETLKESMGLWNDFELLRIKSLCHNMSTRQILFLDSLSIIKETNE